MFRTLLMIMLVLSFSATDAMAADQDRVHGDDGRITYGNAGPSEDGCSCTTERTAGCNSGLCNRRGYCTTAGRREATCAGYDCSAYGGQDLAWTVCDNGGLPLPPTCTNKGSHGYFCRTAAGKVADQYTSTSGCACTDDSDCATGAVCGLTGRCRTSATGVAASCASVLASSSSSSSSGVLQGKVLSPKGINEGEQAEAEIEEFESMVTQQEQEQQQNGDLISDSINSSSSSSSSGVINRVSFP